MAQGMPIRTSHLFAFTAAALALSGCSKDAALYPSLAIRDAERVTGTFEPVPAPVYVPPKPGTETLGRIGKLRADAQAAHTKFLAIAERRRDAAGQGGDVGSEAWAAAQVAVADLTAARSETMIPLAELDILFVTAQNDGAETAEIEQARSEVDAWVAAEDKLIASF